MKNILVIAEQVPDEISPAYEKAFSFADNNKVHFLCVVYDPLFDQRLLMDEDERQALQQKAMSKTSAKLSDVLADRPEITHEVLWHKNLSEAISEVCSQQSYDLIIKTGQRSESLIHTPTDFRLFQMADIPVMIMHQQKWRAKPVVLATIDYSNDDAAQMQLNEKVLSEAKGYAETMGADVHCCYTVTFNPVLSDMDIINQDKVLDKFNKNRLGSLKEFVAKHGIAPDHLHLDIGKVEKTIPSLANKLKADLVVVGTHRRKGASKLLLGNSCEKILKVMRTDILAIKPD